MTTLSRREFVVVSLAAGFTLATGPINAAVITTPATGLLAGEVKVPVADGVVPAYRARPAGAGPFPVVLVVQEIFGVHEHIKDVCRRFAQAGYLAVAPELYARQGDVTKLTDIKEIIGIVSKVPDGQVMADLDAARAWAKTDGGNDARVAVTGFCWGGRIVWLYAAHSPTLRAGVAWYGQLRGDKSALKPRSALESVADLHAPVLGLYGGKDQGIPVADVEAMRAALKAAGKPGELIVFADAGHGFHADYRPSYDAAAARAGWQKLLGFFTANGV